MLQRLPFYAGPVLGIAAGIVAAVFGAAVAGSPVKAAVLPAALALLLFLLFDRRLLLLLILAFRSAGDIVFEATRLSVAGYQIGVGGIVNAVVIMVVILLVAEKPAAVPRKVLVAWGLFLLSLLIGVAISPVRGDAARIYLAVLSYAAIFVGAFHVVKSPEDFRFCARVVVWSSLIPAAYALVELATGGGHRADGFRLQSTFAHPNIFAFYLILVVSLTLYLLKGPGKPLTLQTRAGLSLYMAFLLGLLLLTQTRSAWLACFTIFALYAAIFERRYLAYLVAVPLLALLVPSVQERLLDLGSGNEYVQYAKLNSFAWRKLIWETGLRWMHPDHYFLGYGLESFRHYSPLFFPLSVANGPGAGAHNVYVECLFELGVAGLFLFLWLFGSVLRILATLRRHDQLAAFVSITAIVAYLMESVSDNLLGYLSFNWYFWFIIGAATAAALAPPGERRDEQAAAGHAGPGSGK